MEMKKKNIFIVVKKGTNGWVFDPTIQGFMPQGDSMYEYVELAELKNVDVTFGKSNIIINGKSFGLKFIKPNFSAGYYALV